jgi:hypothetical protein
MARAEAGADAIDDFEGEIGSAMAALEGAAAAVDAAAAQVHLVAPTTSDVGSAASAASLQDQTGRLRGTVHAFLGRVRAA